jgi:phosphatidate cytidylyltransferase
MNKELIKRIISSIILLPLSIYLITHGFYLKFIFISICFTIAIYEWHMMSQNKSYKIYGYFFLVFSFYTFYEISTELIWIFYVITICVLTDIGGYVFGKVFKGPKLTKISPNKTYAGMLGGYALSLIIVIVIMNYNNNPGISIQILIITIILSTVSQIGDIIVSYFKRLSNIKNTGNIIPGHGGLLDRIDGMIFAFPIFFFVDLTDYLS